MLLDTFNDGIKKEISRIVEEEKSDQVDRTQNRYSLNSDKMEI